MKKESVVHLLEWWLRAMLLEMAIGAFLIGLVCLSTNPTVSRGLGLLGIGQLGVAVGYSLCRMNLAREANKP